MAGLGVDVRDARFGGAELHAVAEVPHPVHGGVGGFAGGRAVERRGDACLHRGGRGERDGEHPLHAGAAGGGGVAPDPLRPVVLAVDRLVVEAFFTARGEVAERFAVDALHAGQRGLGGQALVVDLLPELVEPRVGLAAHDLPPCFLALAAERVGDRLVELVAGPVDRRVGPLDFGGVNVEDFAAADAAHVGDVGVHALPGGRLPGAAEVAVVGAVGGVGAFRRAAFEAAADTGRREHDVEVLFGRAGAERFGAPLRRRRGLPDRGVEVFVEQAGTGRFLQPAFGVDAHAFAFGRRTFGEGFGVAVGHPFDFVARRFFFRFRFGVGLEAQPVRAGRAHAARFAVVLGSTANTSVPMPLSWATSAKYRSSAASYPAGNCWTLPLTSPCQKIRRMLAPRSTGPPW